MKYKQLLKSNIGKHNDIPDSDFNAEQLKNGIKIEMEHTNNSTIAKSIAKDHLSEFKNYYIALIKMEKELRNEI
jgi:hypothetical protein